MVIHREMLLVEERGGKGGERHHRICKMCICMRPVWMWF